MAALMLWQLWKAPAPRAERVAISTGAKMANGLLFLFSPGPSRLATAPPPAQQLPGFRQDQGRQPVAALASRVALAGPSGGSAGLPGRRGWAPGPSCVLSRYEDPHAERAFDGPRTAGERR